MTTLQLHFHKIFANPHMLNDIFVEEYDIHLITENVFAIKVTLSSQPFVAALISLVSNSRIPF